MKRKLYSLLTLCIGLLISAFGFLLPLIANKGNGIIGGADAPTYAFLVLHSMHSLPFCLIVLGITLAVSALFCFLFTKTVQRNCTVKTTMLSLGISGVGGLGLVCTLTWFAIVAFHNMKRYPIAYPVSIALGMLCLIAFLLLIALYLKERSNHRSMKGLMIDIFTSILWLPCFFFILCFLSNYLRYMR